VTPVRGRVIDAKLGALALTGTIVATAVMSVALGATLPRLLAAGVAVDLADGRVARAVIGNLAAGPLFGVLGVGVGALLRNQLSAVLVAGGWGFFGEGILAIVLGGDAVRWLPGMAAQALTDAGGDGLPLGAAAALVTAYAGAMALLATRHTVSRDVV
jgi:ABC-2 type transport system permease protein